MRETINNILKNEKTFLGQYSMLRPKILDYVLRNCRKEERPEDYEFLKYSLEVYWDSPLSLYNNLINFNG